MILVSVSSMLLGEVRAHWFELAIYVVAGITALAILWLQARGRNA